MTEYSLLSNRTRQVFETDDWTPWKPSKAPPIASRLGRSVAKDLPDRAIGQLGMLVRLGVGDASVEKPQLFVARHPQAAA